MSDKSEIQWTDATWPVTVGCEAVSPGCDHCYAAVLTSGRLKHQPAYAGLAVAGKFTGEVRCLPDRLDWPLRWRKPRRIFVCSMSDLFHEDVPAEFIASVFAVMARCPQHTFQVLTKRHARIRSLLSSRTFADRVNAAARGASMPGYCWPLPNVWLGVSVENQKWADIRIPALLDAPAAVRFLSCEPLLGPIDLHARDTRTFGPRWLPAVAHGVNTPDRRAGDGSWVGGLYAEMYGPNLAWVITGGESGAGHRPTDPAWFRQIRDQCKAAGVAYLHKQNGGRTPKAGGRELDGRTWDEYPTAAGHDAAPAVLREEPTP